jgi:peroxin-10
LVDAVAAPPEGPHGLTRNANGATQSAFSMGMWLVRLHLAHYCITGKYPSWLYRFAGLNLKKLERHGDTPRIPSRPTTVRMVGALIGVQAAATLFRHTANALSHWMANRLERNAAAAANNNNSIESRPSIFPTPTDKQVSSSTNNKKSASTCAICRMPRSHAAAPSTCGHVCCWNCLMQWVSAVRPECPLCRSPCRPQDIICLYDYEQPSED